MWDEKVVAVVASATVLIIVIAVALTVRLVTGTPDPEFDSLIGVLSGLFVGAVGAVGVVVVKQNGGSSSGSGPKG